jgi:hypothetical protein
MAIPLSRRSHGRLTTCIDKKQWPRPRKGERKKPLATRFWRRVAAADGRDQARASKQAEAGAEAEAETKNPPPAGRW